MLNSSGDIIDGTEADASGLPEPGYHIELPAEVQAWLDKNATTPDGGTEATGAAQNLAEILSFTYNENGDNSRTWDLNYQGIYTVNEETNEPTQYVYSLEPANNTQDEVRLQFEDDDGSLITTISLRWGQIWFPKRIKCRFIPVR